MPSLERLEYLTYSHHHAAALDELKSILALLHDTSGKPGTALEATLLARLSGEECDSHIVSRLSVAYAALLCNPDLVLSPADFQQLIVYHPIVSSLFASTPFRNADYALAALYKQNGPGQPLRIPPNNFSKFCLLLTTESELPFHPEALWQFHKPTAAALFVAMLSHAIMARPAAHAKREALLAWLPNHLEEIGNLQVLPFQLLIGVYMMCSYADLPGKHNIKKPLNRLIRQALVNNGFSDCLPWPAQPARKPVMLVILEWFSARHSIYRTHSTTLRAAKEVFHLVGVGYEKNTDDIGRALFDEFHMLNGQEELIANLRFLTTLNSQLQTDVVYYPSIGMTPLTAMLSNLRLAPVQLAALGHPATTHSPYIDAILVEEDYVGDVRCFSEKIIALPKDSLPYVPPAPLEGVQARVRPGNGAIVKVGVVASMIKLNPGFLNTCRRIVELATIPVEFRFYDGGSDGFGLFHVRSAIRDYLPHAVLKNCLKYEDFMMDLDQCDLFVNPFPFGNTNGLVDTFRLALPGVCLTGAEVHSHIDEGLMRRVGLPDWLIARTVDEYIAAALRLIHHPEERMHISRHLLRVDAEHILFSGRPAQFVQAIQALRANVRIAA